MNHFDRLMQRALALPRAACQVLFDPFEQVASAGRVEAPAPYRTNIPTPPTGPMAQNEVLPVSAQTHPETGTQPTLGAAAVLPQAPAVPNAGTAVPMPPTASLPQAAPQRTDAAAPRPLDALARADRFMHELGVPGAPLPSITSSADPVAPHRPPLEHQPASPKFSPSMSPISSPERHLRPDDAAAPVYRPRLEPVAPVPRSEPAYRPPAARTRAAPANEGTAPVDSAQKPAVAPPSANPVRVQAASRSPWANDVERLGRDTPMVRFGVGQW